MRSNSVKKHQVDYLIIGSGLAGLSLAIRLADRFPDRTIAVVSKLSLNTTNTSLAQGGIAAVPAFCEDSFDIHIEDTLKAGGGLCNPEVVREFVQDGPSVIKELKEFFRVKFTQNELGDSLHLEGGHSNPRVFHYKDSTGNHFQERLIDLLFLMKNIQVFEHHFVHRLYKRSGVCIGAGAVSQENEFVVFESRFTVLATGGIGQLYEQTSNSVVATGDGVALAHKIGATVKDLPYIQFHPTLLKGTNVLLSEALRGAGALLVNEKGERFMLGRDPKVELGCRDLVARSVQEQKEAYLDLRKIHDFDSRFPFIYQKLKEYHFSPSKDLIPIEPAAHYCCGGVASNIAGATSIDRLYALGEVACTGFHGANRLASNSLLEAVASAYRCFETLSEIPLSEFGYLNVSSIDVCEEVKSEMEVESKIDLLKNLVSTYLGPFKTNEGLLEIQRMLHVHFYQELHEKRFVSQKYCELQNRVIVTHLLTKEALLITENRGTYFNRDLVQQEALLPEEEFVHTLL